MAGSAGSIYVDLILKDSKYIEGTKRSAKASKEFEKTVVKSAAVVGAAIGLATSAIALNVGKQFAAIDATNKMARVLGIATEQFQALALVAEEAGVAQENLSNLIVRSQKAIIQGAQGGEQYQKAFKTLGLDIQELLNLKPDQQFENIVEALSKIENPTLRNATAMEVFGKSGRDVINMIEDFGGKIEEARAFNDKFNLSVSQLDGRVIEEANDTFARLGLALDGLANTISIRVAPLVTEFSNSLLNAGADGESFGRSVDSGIEIASKAFDILNMAIKGVEIAFNSLTIVAAESIGFVSRQIYEAGERAAGFFNLIPGVSVEAEDAFLKIGVASATASLEAKNNIKGIIYELQNLESAANRVSKAQSDAIFRQAGSAIKDYNGIQIPNANDLQKIAESLNGSIAIDVEDEGANKEKTREAAKLQNELSRTYEKNRDLILGLDKATIDYNDTLEELNELLKANVITDGQFAAAVQRLDEEFEKNSEKVGLWGMNLEEFGKEASRNLQDVFKDFFMGADEGFDGLKKGFANALKEMVANAAATNLAALLFGKADKKGNSSGGLLGGLFGSGGSSGGGNFLGDLFSGFFADGGYVPPGQWGIAGENGPEPIFGGMTGTTVIPNKPTTGGNIYQIDARGADQGAVRRLESALLTLAGPGVIESRVQNAQTRGAL